MAPEQLEIRQCILRSTMAWWSRRQPAVMADRTAVLVAVAAVRMVDPLMEPLNTDKNGTKIVSQGAEEIPFCFSASRGAADLT